MIRIIREKDKITIGGNPLFIGIGIVALIMAASGIRLFIGLLQNEALTTADIFGIVFVSIWTAVVLWMSAYAFITNSTRVTITREGVFCSSILDKRELKWTDIRDWGLSYSSSDRSGNNTYYLYFSPHVCEIKNNCKKRLRGKMIKTFVTGDEYYEAISSVVPFCRQLTDIPPFIGEDRYHFRG